MLYFTSDTHYFHKNILAYSKRPFADVEEMNQTMIDRWNKVVKPTDSVWILGDISFAKDHNETLKILGQLNGAKGLIAGNHDVGFLDFLYDGIERADEFFPLGIHDLYEIFYQKQRIVMCHYALRVWDKSHYGSWSLYGHSHGHLPDDPNLLSIDVGVDCHDFTPISFDQVKALMAKKTFKPVERNH